MTCDVCGHAESDHSARAGWHEGRCLAYPGCDCDGFAMSDEDYFGLPAPRWDVRDTVGYALLEQAARDEVHQVKPPHKPDTTRETR